MSCSARNHQTKKLVREDKPSQIEPNAFCHVPDPLFCGQRAVDAAVVVAQIVGQQVDNARGVTLIVGGRAGGYRTDPDLDSAWLWR
jgi:hypothetical protein